LTRREIDDVATGLLDEPMAGEKPKTLAAKLHMDVIESARIVAAYRGETITDLLSDILRPVLARMEQEEVSKRTKAAKRKGAE
jgi:hypothetical protein